MSFKTNFKLEKIKFVLIFLTALLVFVFGILGFKEITGNDFNIFGAINSTIILFLLGTPDPIPGSTFLLIAKSLALILFGLGALSLVFDRAQNVFVIAKIRFTYKGHVVIITLNEISHKLAKELLEKGHKVVIVENDNANNFIFQTKELGGLVIIGNGSDGHIINDAGITNLLDSNRDSKTNASYVFSKRLNIQLFHMITDTCTIRNLLEQTEQIDTLSKIINYYYSMKYEFSHELKEHWKVQNADLLVSELESCLHKLSYSNEKISEGTIQKRIIMLLSKKTGIHYNSLYSKLSVEKRWNILTHRKKDSNRYAARQLSSKFSSLKRIGCEPLTVENITHFYARLAPMEHKRWTAEKMVFNYKYGPLVSDKADRYVLKDVLKIHDQLIPYDKLTEIEKEKDLNLLILLPLLSRIYKSN